MQCRRSQKEIISCLIVLHSVGGLVSMVFTHPMLSFKCRMADYYALYTLIYIFFSPYSLYNQSVWQTLSTSCENDLFLETNTYTIT
jgi:hypothetical protein